MDSKRNSREWRIRLIKYGFELRASALLGTGIGLGLILSAFIQRPLGGLETRALAEEKAARTPELTNAQPVPSTISGLLPDQSHAMADVGYHFSNLWFAADKENWPLAKYYLQETRSHLNWAVRLHPVRTPSTGAKVNLNAILQTINNSFLTKIDSAIANKDTT